MSADRPAGPSATRAAEQQVEELVDGALRALYGAQRRFPMGYPVFRLAEFLGMPAEELLAGCWMARAMGYVRPVGVGQEVSYVLTPRDLARAERLLGLPPSGS
ncbi:MAG: hypothetical protein QN122_07230 [Armatimonadota bacterium]|nr:hypothetical protein [Armatimonadota bacterium]MDR7480461.1 hypothetical protein [Armatimonadota bacterium]MDR7489211.1 hypothetical protein [Armatimonadota bacterium]MDR7491228.1 hypothetical protein [Armatimonadota bacterium]MDR7502656.1 hypothetical protein [Armatimonadota bacterium]